MAETPAAAPAATPDNRYFDEANLAVRRVGSPSTHPLFGRELRALRKLRREAPSSEFVFVTERGALFTTTGFANMFDSAKANLGIKAHVHMLRHSAGYCLANKVTTLDCCRVGSGTRTFSTP
jgi:integrase